MAIGRQGPETVILAANSDSKRTMDGANAHTVRTLYHIASRWVKINTREAPYSGLQKGGR